MHTFDRIDLSGERQRFALTIGRDVDNAHGRCPQVVDPYLDFTAGLGRYVDGERVGSFAEVTDADLN